MQLVRRYSAFASPVMTCLLVHCRFLWRPQLPTL